MRYLAQDFDFSFGSGSQTISGPLDDSITDLPSLVGVIVSYAIPIASGILLIVCFWGGYEYLMSGGQADKIKAGSAKITWGLIGFFLLVFSYTLAWVVGNIFGLQGL